MTIVPNMLIATPLERTGPSSRVRIRHTRRNTALRMVSLAVLVTSGIMVGRLEHNLFAQERTGTFHVAHTHARGLDSAAEGPPSTPAPPANLRFNHLSVADGLSNADVRTIAQDRQGFMWFGTWLGGLNRYDGYKFKVYKHDDQDGGSLSADSIWALYLDRAGTLWVGLNGGVDRYDRDTDSFVHYRHRADDPTGLPSSQPMSFLEDESGTLWVGTSGGLGRFDRTSGRFMNYRRTPNDPPSMGAIEVRSLCLDVTTSLLWVATWHGGVSVLDRSTGHITAYKNDPNDPASLSSNDVAHICQDRKGNLWLSTSHGLNRFDPRTHTFIRYLHDPANAASLSDDYVTQTYEDHAGRFWVSTNNGLNLMDRDLGTFARYLHSPSDPSSLSSNVINWNGLYEDAAGALWIGMRSTGIDRLAGRADKFVTYRYASIGANGPSSSVITGLATGSAGELWVGTEAGVDRFDGRTFTHYLADPNDPTRLSPGPQRSVAQDSHGAVWTGTYGGGLDRLDGDKVKHFHHDPKDGDSPANDYIASLVADTGGGLWIGVHGNGLDYFDGRHFIHFPPNPADPAGLTDPFVIPLLLDLRGMLWLGTARSGLVRFDTHTRKFTTYYMDPKQPGNQAVNWTEDVYSDGAQTWVASPSGLFRFDPATGSFTRHYTEKDGLPSNSVVAVQGDAQGKLWVGTVKGLSKFDPATETFRNYDRYDGLQGNAFFVHCHATARDGRLFFGGSDGLSAFYPTKLADNPTPPPVVLTDFQLFNKPSRVGGTDSPLQQAIHVASSLALRYDQSVFSFEFAALNYDWPQKNQYAYKLDGFDRDWQFTDATRRLVTYTNLDPADYTFRVKASNNDGVWNEQGVVLHLTILPPWWKTTLFRALCAASLFLLLWTAYQLRVRQLAHRFDMRLEERVAERTRIARDLHDTLLQSFHALLLHFQTGINMLEWRPADARKVLEDALERATQAIAEGRDAISGLRMSTVETNDLAAAITTIAKELAAAHGIEASTPFQVLVEGTPRELHPIVRDEVYWLATEALRNAFQHAAATKIEVEIRYDEKYFRLRTRDDGKGIPPDVLSGRGREGHYGLHGMRERAKVVGGQLSIWSQVNSGTEIEIVIPGATAYMKAAGSFWRFGKRSTTDTHEKATMKRE